MTNFVFIALLVGCGGLGDFTDALKQGLSQVPGGGALSKVVDVAAASDNLFMNRLAPVEEFYLGRKVSAQVLGAYPNRLPQDSPVVQYVAKVGATLSLASRAPYPYRSFVYIVLDTPEINAFAAPGGILFVTTGMLRFLTSEDALAGVLGHEIGHVELRHGARTLEQEGSNAFTKVVVKTAVDEVDSVAEVPGVFGAINDKVVDQTFSGIRNGYSVKLEAEADARSVEICASTGYAPLAFIEVLHQFEAKQTNYGGGQYPQDRVARASDILGRIPGAETITPLAARTERYVAMVAQLKP